LVVGETELAKRLAVGGVGLHHVGEPVGPPLHDLGVLVDAEHVVAQSQHRIGDLPAEPAEPDHRDGPCRPATLSLSQRSVAPLE